MNPETENNFNYLIHIPVLKDEVIKLLDLKPGMTVADLTVGAGGHTREILKIIGDSGKMLLCDADCSIIQKLPDTIKNNRNVVVVCDSFANFDLVADKASLGKFDAILMDLGVSSWQLDNNDRGFSYNSEAVLDMRMGQQGLTAAQILNTYSREDLKKIFKEFGDINRAGELATKIVSFRRAKSFTYVSDLKKVVSGFSGYRGTKGNVLGRVWQALRVEVNSELDSLKKVLPQAVEWLKPGGRLAVISFHSGEDRIVKNFFRKNSAVCSCPKDFPVCRCMKVGELEILTRKAIQPSKAEIEKNIRSHSAKLRVAIKK